MLSKLIPFTALNSTTPYFKVRKVGTFSIYFTLHISHTSPVNYWEAYPEKKCQRGWRSRGPCGGPRLSVALARLVDLKAALLAETRARGPDGSRMRSPQLARCSRDQLRRRMGQHGGALGRGRGGGCEVFRAPPSLCRVQSSEFIRAKYAELVQTARSAPACRTQSRLRDGEHGGRRTILPTGPCLADSATPTGCGCVA